MEASLYSSQNDRVEEFDTLDWRNVYLYFDFQMEYYSQLNTQELGLSFGSSVYACSPPSPGSNGSKTERFEEIIVITLFDYNENLKANDTITSNIDLSLGYKENPSPYYFGNNLNFLKKAK